MAIKGDYRVTELCKQFGVAPSYVFKWKKEFLEGAGDIFAAGGAKTSSDDDNCNNLYQQIGRLQVENSFLKKGSVDFFWIDFKSR